MKLNVDIDKVPQNKAHSKSIYFLKKLLELDAIAGLKTGFEVEDFDDEELLYLKSLGDQLKLPITVKIGGPEARRDIRFCLNNGIDKILAPMIESVYALDLFVDTAFSLSGENTPKLAINLESYLAYKSLDSFISARSFSRLNSVTIGRGDLSASMHLNVEDPEVIRVTRNALKKISNAGKETSVGGGLRVAGIKEMLENLPSNHINTRHIILNRQSLLKRSPHEALSLALCFELELYRSLSKLFKVKSSLYDERISILRKRLEVKSDSVVNKRA